MNRISKTLFLLVLDIVIIFVSYILSILLITNFSMNNKDVVHILENLYWIIPIHVFWFVIFHLYKSLWRYASIQEAINVFYSIIVSCLTIIGFDYVFNRSIPVNGIITANIILFIGIIGDRFSYRALRVFVNYKKYVNVARTLIIGAGDAGNMLIKEISINPSMNNKVVCLVDDDKTKIGKIIQGKKVVGTTDELEEIVEKYKIDEIIVALPSASRKEIQTVLKKCDKVNKKTKIMPPFYEVIDNKVGVRKIRDVEIEDLLGRDEIKINDQGISDFVKGEVVLVTGGGGSIGSELCRQIVKYKPSKLIIFDIYENNAYDIQNELLMHKVDVDVIVLIGSIRDEKRLDEVFSTYKPNIIFHAAAHKHVPLMEFSPKEAIKNNVFGTYNVAKKAMEYKAKKFVLISTDKAVNPTNIMGATKRYAEMIIQAFNKECDTQYAAVRFGNVLGSNGSVIPLFKKQIKEGGPVTVTHKEVIRYFMTIPEAVQLVLQAGAFAQGGEIFVLDMGEPVKIIELAEKLIRFSGYEPYSEINIEITGLRPGEKLYEELILQEEGLKQTYNEKIFISEVNGYYLKEINKQLQELSDIIEKEDNVKIKELFTKYVDTYKNDC